MNDTVNLAEKLALLDQPYSPGIIGQLNELKLMLVKACGEFIWYKHDDTDDFFLVLNGRLTIRLRDRDVHLDTGELFVVPRGIEHCPSPTTRPMSCSSSRWAPQTPATPAATAPHRTRTNHLTRRAAA